MKKTFLSADALVTDSFRLAQQIYESGFCPDLIIGVLRGGAPISIAVHEYFSYQGQRARHRSIYSSSYCGIDARSETVNVEGVSNVVSEIRAGDKLLIVDDVFDTGKSIETILGVLTTEIQKTNLGDEKPDVRVATVWFKPDNNLTKIKPNYFLNTTKEWLVFPHELTGLTDAEIAEYKPAISDTLHIK